MSQNSPPGATGLATRILKVSSDSLGSFQKGDGVERIGTWVVTQESSPSLQILQDAGKYLSEKDTPVAFPTETVYGLGADATRSTAVKGIYAAKGRPSDNPLIIHISDLEMLRGLLRPTGSDTSSTSEDPIPPIYKPLIERFWPGPLTILLPNPVSSKLAPEVTAGLSSFGARMPSSPLSLSLIKLAGAPLAGPSANASTKPSPTTAQHVLEDMNGRIEFIIDGGPCQVGVESTVVDGLCDPPVVLRPGGVSVDQLRQCPGWENVEKGYKDQSEMGKAAPRAPGMKYKHYSPKARVVLYEASLVAGKESDLRDELQSLEARHKVGIIRTRHWKRAAGLDCGSFETCGVVNGTGPMMGDLGQESSELDVREADLLDPQTKKSVGIVMDVCIGAEAKSIAHGLFSALRELDRRGSDVIFVEGTVDDEDIGAAVMNRLRKAASIIRS